MSVLAVRIGAGVLALLALVALRGKRWAYFAFIVLGLAYFPAQAHFHVHAPKCEQILPTVQQIVPLLQNYLSIALFAGVYWLSWVQLRDANARGLWAFVATLVVAALFELAEGMTAVMAVAKTVRHAKPAVAGVVQTHCRVQDLVPAVAAALGAALLLAIWARLTKKPAYVRLGKPRQAAAPRTAAPPPRAVVQPRTFAQPRTAYDPPVLYTPPPPPADFSPGAAVTSSSDASSSEEAAPTEEVATNTVAAARAAIGQRLRSIMGRLRVGPMLGRVWAAIWGRRRGIVIGVVVLVLVGVGGFVALRLLTRAPVAVVQADTTTAAPLPPPPPPRPLQSEVEGYYEPSYKFTVFDRRFTRLTLRPEPSVRFTRPGVRQDVACEDSRIGQDAVRLRCTLEPYGVVTLEGRFPLRYVTSKLDMPVLSAVITVTNTRGEVQYRARDSFYWHVPDPSQ